ncbi:hypothetical protein As57867_004805, partial [Aphanomyces stellatus]
MATTKETYSIDDAVQVLADTAIDELLRTLELTPSISSQSYTGSRSLKPNSKVAYTKHLRGLKYFCSLVGDYESLLMLLDRPPQPFCPAMNPQIIADFIRFKRQQNGTPFYRISNPDEQLVDVLDAVGCLSYAARGHRGTFFDKCTGCCSLSKRTNYKGCQLHRGKPMLWRIGNPKQTELIENVMKESLRQGADYVVEGDSPLTPWELITIRNHLLSTNGFNDYQLFVMVLLSVKLFLRSDEVVRIRLSDFSKDLAIISDGGVVEALAVSVKGKTDVKPVTLMLWSDDVLPQLCPIRHLLILIKASGIKNEGYIFPGTDIDIGCLDGHFFSETYHTRFKSVCEKLIDRDGPFGTHSCRKTAYLFAVWGGGSDGDMMLSARHKQLGQAMKYKRDAAFLLNVAISNNKNLASVVTPWKSIFCADAQMGRSINSNGSRGFKPLYELAFNFIHKLCACPLDAGILRMITDVLNFNKPTSTKESIDILCKKYFPPEVLSRVMDLMSTYAFELTYLQSQTTQALSGENNSGGDQNSGLLPDLTEINVQNPPVFST